MMVPSGYEQLWMLTKGFEGAFPTNGPTSALTTAGTLPALMLGRVKAMLMSIGLHP